jgi:serine/threonine-protein kinase RsbW
VQVTVHLELPRDAQTIPVLRRLCGRSLEVVGANPDIIDDVALALTEACANVLHHVEDGGSFEVIVGFDEQHAFVDVTDRGEGFDPEELEAPSLDDESGRGVHLMRQLMDSVYFDSASGSGTTVHLEKQLVWQPGAPMERLSTEPVPTAPS